MGSLAQYSAADILSVMVWTFFVAVIFLLIGYCMGRREDVQTMARQGRDILRVGKKEPEPEPDGDFWEDCVPTAINERGRE